MSREKEEEGKPYIDTGTRPLLLGRSRTGFRMCTICFPSLLAREGIALVILPSPVCGGRETTTNRQGLHHREKQTHGVIHVPIIKKAAFSFRSNMPIKTPPRVGHTPPYKDLLLEIYNVLTPWCMAPLPVPIPPGVVSPLFPPPPPREGV